jgi:hypothetical protein
MIYRPREGISWGSKKWTFVAPSLGIKRNVGAKDVAQGGVTAQHMQDSGLGTQHHKNKRKKLCLMQNTSVYLINVLTYSYCNKIITLCSAHL